METGETVSVNGASYHYNAPTPTYIMIPATPKTSPGALLYI